MTTESLASESEAILRSALPGAHPANVRRYSGLLAASGYTDAEVLDAFRWLASLPRVPAADLWVRMAGMRLSRARAKAAAMPRKGDRL